MSTRGTYLIEGKLLYNHCDNYPAGAAYHFANVLEQYGHIDYVSMIRTGAGKRQYGPDFKPTSSIYDGPAEYHYKITKSDGKTFVEANKIPMDTEKDSLVFMYKMELHEFINTNLSAEDLKEIGGPVLPIRGKYASHTNYFTTPAAKEKLNFELMQGMGSLLYHGGVGNASSNFGAAGDIAQALGLDKACQNWNKYFAPIFKKSYGHDENSTVFDWGGGDNAS